VKVGDLVQVGECTYLILRISKAKKVWHRTVTVMLLGNDFPYTVPWLTFTQNGFLVVSEAK
tara:strand:- start:1391 stop:1573 length:183 start_codon:yes stop_codon:yes gene_type:complete